MWEFAANHPGWFFLYMLIVVPCSAFVLLLLLLMISGSKVSVSRNGSDSKKFGSRPNASKVLSSQEEKSQNAGTTRH